MNQCAKIYAKIKVESVIAIYEAIEKRGSAITILENEQY